MSENTLQQNFNLGKVILIVVICLISGLLISLLIPRPIVGVINFSSEIYGYTANEFITQIDYARDNPRIKAVVIIMDSPGGTVTDTEAIYMELSRLREKKPVVLMIQGMAASGGYYVAAATDYIISEPSALVGNIGVLRYTPSTPVVTEDIYSTGPYKLWGGPGETFIREMDLMKTGFLSAIKLGRGDRLLIDDETILRGQIWPGTEALKLGMVDELGSVSRAYEKAAELAKIAHFTKLNLREPSGLPEEVINYYYSYEDSEGSSKVDFPFEEGFYFLFIGNQEVQ